MDKRWIITIIPAILLSSACLVVSGLGKVVRGSGHITSETRIASGLAGLIVTISPFWMVGVEALLPGGEGLHGPTIFGMAVGMVWLLSIAWARQHPLTPQRTDLANVTYYSQEEYLALLDTGTGTLQPSKGDPAYAKQEVISVPPEADNRSQTVVVPPDLKLAQDLALPNVVSWPQTAVAVPIEATTLASKLPGLPSSVVAPVPEVAADASRRAIDLSPTVVAPTPDVADVLSSHGIHAPQMSVVEPPPSVDSSRTRRTGDLNIAQSDVVAPAPALTLEAQRSAIRSLGGAIGQSEAGVVPPPPSGIGGDATANTGSRMIALGIHPASLTGPITPPRGNRRGMFAAGPSGRTDATGAPEIAGNPTGNSPALGSGRSTAKGRAGSGARRS